MELSSLFVARAAAAGRPVAATPELEETLSRLLAQARATWPTVTLEAQAFLGHLAERLPPEDDVVAALRALHATDLYLACACALGDARAVELFEASFMVHVARFLGGIDDRAEEVDEVKQTLRARLLISVDGQPPRIAEYAGRGPLGAWVRRAAVRQLLYRRRAHVPEGPMVPDATSLPSAAPDQELLYLKVRYGPELDAAFREALRSLPERDRTLLHLYFVNGLTAEALAAMYRVVEGTVRRWLSESRKRIVEGTRQRLAARLDISATECQSLVAALQSQLDLSVLKSLKEGDRE